MSLVERRGSTLHIEDIALPEIARQFGTPCYVYSRRALTQAFAAYRDALAGRRALVCYAVKANSNLAILNLFARLGAGFDIVSGGELARVLAAGGDAKKVVFSGVGKTREEIAAALRAGIKCFNVESSSELDRINAVAGELQHIAPISFRVNPDVDPKTHPYISTGLKASKFGVAHEDALALYRRAAALPHVRVTGIDCHIGSQLLDPAPAAEAARKIVALVDALAAEGIVLDHIDLGGGMGVRYRDETPPSTADYLAPVLEVLAGRREEILVEPGRSLVGNAGLLLTKVEVFKPGSAHNFVIVDAAMNDLMRPALYEAWHDIVQVEAPHDGARLLLCDVVGPVCESGDFLGHERMLATQEGDLLAILSAGAYGMAMSSNYNSRPRAAEVIVDGGTAHLVRKREDVAQLYAGEATLP